MKHVTLLTLVLFSSMTLFGVSVDELMEGARTDSLEAQILELQRDQNRTSLDLLSIEDGFAFQADTGTLQYGRQTFENLDPNPAAPDEVTNDSLIVQGFSLSADLNGSVETMISAGFDRIVYDISGGSFYLKPSFSVEQPLEQFFQESELEELEETLTSLNDLLSYEEGMLDIELQVLENLKQLVQLNKEQADITFSIETTQRDYNQAIKLGTYSETAPEARSVKQTIAAYEQSLTTNRLNYDLIVQQLVRLTGYDEDEIEQISDFPEPVLSYQQRSLDKTAVLIARTELAIALQEMRDNAEPDWGISLTGAYSLDVNSMASPSWEDNHQLEAGVSGSVDNFSFSGGARTSITNDEGTSLAGYIRGTWSGDGKSRERELTKRQLEQIVEIKRRQYDQAKLTYDTSIQELRSDISVWEEDAALLDLQVQNAEQQLKEAELYLEREIGSQTDVDEAQHELNQLAFDIDEHTIDGLIIQKKIEKLQL